MKIGLSSYSLYNRLIRGEMDVVQAVKWVAGNGGEHVELAPIGFELEGNDRLLDAVVEQAKRSHIDISAYSINANLLPDGEGELEREVRRVKGHVDIARRLGVRLMRHDIAALDRPLERSDIEHFDAELARMAQSCREIADYAAQYGITTMVENHGRFINGGDRIRRLVRAVGRPNYKCLADIGNFLCVDEEPLVGVAKVAALTDMVHFKDFYVRGPGEYGGENWIPTASGRMLRGAIVGHGDIDVRGVFSLLRASGFDGYVSVEFEGMEDCEAGSRIGMNNLKRLLAE